MILATALLAVQISQNTRTNGTFPINARMTRVENGLLPARVPQSELGKGQKLEDRMAKFKAPGISIAVIDEGKVAWAKGYGVIESGTDNKVTTGTLFQAGSVSKSVAAMGALAMVESHQLDLNEDVNKKLKSWKFPDSELTAVEKVTLARILSHTAGVTIHGFAGYAVDAPIPTTVDILSGKKPANTPAIYADVTPGTIWRYSGGGYTVMQLLMTDVANKTFPALMKDTVLSKLGMSDSTYLQPLPSDLAAKTASGHYQNGSKVKGGWHVYPEMAAAGLWTTPTDLAKFAIDIQDTFRGRSQKVLSQGMVKQMLTNQKDNDGLGVFLAGTGPNLRFFHNGRDEGFDSMMIAYAEAGKGAVIMANANLDNDLINEILRSIAKEYNWPGYNISQKALIVVSPAVLKSMVGRYELQKDFIIEIREKDGQLFVQATNQPQLELITDSENSFIVVGANAAISFERDDKGQITNLVLKQNGQTMKAKRLG